MKILTTYALALGVLVAPMTTTQASGPAEVRSQPVKLKNVELDATGSLSGQYVTHTGVPVPGANIVVRIAGDNHKVTSDKDGRFVLPNLKGGRCVVTAGKEVYACQLWAHGTAPPGSIHSVAVVASEASQVRGNGLWPPPYIPVPQKLAALSKKQALGLGILFTGATFAIIELANDDGDDDAS